MERVVEDGFGREPQVDDDLTTLSHRLDAQRRRRGRASRARGVLRAVWRRVVMFYWLVCAAVIVIGLDAVYPGPGRHLAHVFEDPALDLTRPFASCAEAHANGYYSIPQASPGYSPDQDGDDDGRACEPTRDDVPNPLWRLRIMQDRLFEPL